VYDSSICMRRKRFRCFGRVPGERTGSDWIARMPPQSAEREESGHGPPPPRHDQQQNGNELYLKRAGRTNSLQGVGGAGQNPTRAEH